MGPEWGRLELRAKGVGMVTMVSRDNVNHERSPLTISTDRVQHVKWSGRVSRSACEANDNDTSLFSNPSPLLPNGEA
jgi:hypothetical protein